MLDRALLVDPDTGVFPGVPELPQQRKPVGTGFDDADRATEEAFDHFFSYLYSTAPVIDPPPVACSWLDAAKRLWMNVLEAQQACVPVGERASGIFNSAYGRPVAE